MEHTPVVTIIVYECFPVITGSSAAAEKNAPRFFTLKIFIIHNL